MHMDSPQNNHQNGGEVIGSADTYDVIIAGGSYTGLSAALVLGRSLRRVLVIDDGKPCNRQTPHSHGFLTRDGEAPAQLAATARQQLAHYPSVVLGTDRVIDATRQSDGFRVMTAQGYQFITRKLLLATGLVDVMPDIPGFADCWGRSVLHCPYCHGYEVHGQPLGLLGNGDMGYELVTLLQQWSPALTLFTNGPSTLTDSQQQVLTQLGVPVLDTPIAAIDHDAGYMTRVRLADNRFVALKAVFARVPYHLSGNLAQSLGCQLTEQGLIRVSDFGETTATGVYAAGDATSPYRQVAAAVASGAKAAAHINRMLIMEDLRARQVLAEAR